MNVFLYFLLYILNISTNCFYNTIIFCPDTKNLIISTMTLKIQKEGLWIVYIYKLKTISPTFWGWSQLLTHSPKHLLTLNISTNSAAILQGASAWLIQGTPPRVQLKGPAAFTGLPLLRHVCSKLTRTVLQVL